MKSSQTEEAQTIIILTQANNPMTILEDPPTKASNSQILQDKPCFQDPREQGESPSGPKSQEANCKTPPKFVQEIKPFDTIKPSVECRTSLKSPQVQIQIQTEDLIGEAKINFDPKSEILKPDDFSENGSPVIRKKVATRQNTKTPYTATPSFKTAAQYLETTERKKPIKRQFWLVGSPPLYTQNKKVKMNKSYYKGSVELIDKLKEQTLEFRVFKDRDLGNTKAIQNKIRFPGSKADDDCPTDSEQIETARDQVKKELQEALYTEDVQVELSEKIIVDESKALSSKSQTDVNTGGTTSINLEALEFIPVASAQEVLDDADSNVVKNLSFNDIE